MLIFSAVTLRRYIGMKNVQAKLKALEKAIRRYFLFPETDEENAAFDKAHPEQIELPDDLKDWTPIMKVLKDPPTSVFDKWKRKEMNRMLKDLEED